MISFELRGQDDPISSHSSCTWNSRLFLARSERENKAMLVAKANESHLEMGAPIFELPSHTEVWMNFEKVDHIFSLRGG